MNLFDKVTFVATWITVANPELIHALEGRFSMSVFIGYKNLPKFILRVCWRVTITCTDLLRDVSFDILPYQLAMVV